MHLAERLRLRAQILGVIRAFFHERDVVEVQTPVLAPATVTDPDVERSRGLGDVYKRQIQNLPCLSGIGWGSMTDF